ncbi:adenine deaminase C-terminal domain-containing protein [Marinilactibacillus kalidii]|uniref:adenine deaminase C-terminal domain-containing protein n=1 Tax=Marinilactibacillus kalidii TaxID=2820274 RepID=UPI001ABE2832|nr:adenine deaminase C-terminal domain-containing protein [Marinilactibacillus kalidii]
MIVDLIVKNANVYNSYLKTFEQKDVAIIGEKFFYIGEDTVNVLDTVQEIDASGQYMIPGLIDIHMHIESSMTSPAIFSGAGLAHGVTTVVADAHEIANVFGLEGIQAFLKEETIMDIFYAIPSSVPSTTKAMETTGGTVGIEEIRALLTSSRVIALGEAMNFKGIVSEPDSLIRQILNEIQQTRPFSPIEGHVPRVTGMDLAKFQYAGITSDHTQQTPASIYEKISSGLFIELQKKSIHSDNIAMIEKYHFHEYVALVTDDVIADDLLTGHLDELVRLAVKASMSIEQAIYISTFTAARRMGFQDRGAISPGLKADFILLDNLEKLMISTVYKNGTVQHQKGESFSYPKEKPVFPAQFYQSVNCKKLETQDLVLRASGEEALCNVMRIQEVGTFTEHVQRTIPIREGQLDWASCGLALIVVMERYGKGGHMSFGLVENALVGKGAIATTWAHDHHNLMVMGTTVEDIVAAQQSILDMQGGYVVMKEGKLTGSCPLPIGGIITDVPIEVSGKALKKVRQAMNDVGYVNTNEIMSFSTLSLPVSPVLKITDRGLFDVRTQANIPLIEEIK